MKLEQAKLVVSNVTVIVSSLLITMASVSRERYSLHSVLEKLNEDSDSDEQVSDSENGRSLINCAL